MIEIMLNISCLIICIFAVVGVFATFRFLYQWLTMRAIMKEIKRNKDLIMQYNDLCQAKQQFLDFLRSVNGEEV